MKCINCGHEWSADGAARIVACPKCGLEAEYLSDDTVYERAIEAERLGKYDEALTLYKISADAGVPCSAYAVYHCLSRLLRESGDGAMRTEADFWLRTAAEENDPLACFALVRRFDKEGNEPAMMHFLQKAAEAGHESACFRMARFACRAKNPSAARYYLRRISDTNRLAKGWLFFLGRRRPADEPPRIPLPGSETVRLRLADAAETYNAPHVAYRHLLAAGDEPAALYRRVCLERAGMWPERPFSEWEEDLLLAGRGGYTGAYVLLAGLYTDGTSGAPDIGRAKTLYKTAADAGDAEACRIMADAFMDGTFGEKQIERAVEYYRRAGDAGDKEAGARAAEISLTLRTAQEKADAAVAAGQPEAAYRLLCGIADLGHVASACKVAAMALKGQGTPRSYTAAAKYFEIAAAGGSVEGVFGLGVLYAENLGVPFSYEKAMRLLTLAAERGREAAKPLIERLRSRRRACLTRRVYATGCALYHKGRVADAVRFFLTAARLGSARAMFRLGCHAEFGEGVPQNDATAAAWYKRAAEAGCAGESGRLKSGFMLERKRLRETGSADPTPFVAAEAEDMAQMSEAKIAGGSGA